MKGAVDMGTAVIVLILVVICAVAVRSGMKHMKGEGGCCGGGSDEPVEKKVLEGEVIGEKTVYIDGMHCDHCKNTVERYINQIDGAVAKVNLKKNLAVVSYDREIKDEDIIRAVKRADFTVTKIV